MFLRCFKEFGRGGGGGNFTPSPPLAGNRVKGNCLKWKNANNTTSNRIIFFIVYELDTWSRDLNFDFTLKYCLFVGVKLAKSSDQDKSIYSCHSIGFDLRSEFSLPDGSLGKIAFVFVSDMSSSVYIHNKVKDILILGKDPTRWCYINSRSSMFN